MSWHYAGMSYIGGWYAFGAFYLLKAQEMSLVFVKKDSHCEHLHNEPLPSSEAGESLFDIFLSLG